jgi:hypothetical protein
MPERAGRASEQLITVSLRERVIAECSAKPGSVKGAPPRSRWWCRADSRQRQPEMRPGISRLGCADAMTRSPRATTSAPGTGTW